MLLATTGASALTLDKTTGSALLGQPLDVTFSIGLAAGDSAENLCLKTDVFMADAPLPTSQISLSTAPGKSPQELLLRLRSQNVIDDLFVTLVVRAGCEQQISRRYVLLADLPAVASSSALALPQVAAAVIAPIAAASRAANAKPAVKLGLAPGSSVKLAQSASPAAPPNTKALLKPAIKSDLNASAAALSAGATAQTRTTPKPAKGSSLPLPPNIATALLAASASSPVNAPTTGKNLLAKKPAVAASNAPTTQARLKIDAIEALPPAALLSASAANAAWQATQEQATALTQQSVQLLENKERIARLEAQVMTVGAQNSQLLVRLDGLSSQLQRAQEERSSNAPMYLLLLLLASALAVGAWLWQRNQRLMRAEPAWWLAQQGGQARDPRWNESQLAFPEPHAHESSQFGPHNAGPASAFNYPAPAYVSASLSPAPDTAESALGGVSTRAGALAPQRHSAPAPLLPNSPPSANETALEQAQGLRLHAEYFYMAGQSEQAIALLRDHLAAPYPQGAVAHLELLGLYRHLQRHADYSQLRTQCQQAFHVLLPQYAEFDSKSRGLESYFVAMARIQATWPTAKVLDLIHDAVVKQADMPSDELFALEAFRDLLLLHGLASRLQLADLGPAPELAPNLPAAQAAQAPIPLAAEDALPGPKPLASLRLGVDFDPTKSRS